ncbi:MAG: PLP-dependent aminotransferase family protein [bacterium]|jgi:DNA-binding transcriptional MocR family regulator|nr:PLP-dependent aminotransferase family protein [Betaproteobacteria bacterium]
MESLYHRVAADLAQRIGSGAYLPGDRLPGVRTHARAHRISVSTAVTAYQALVDRGLLEARPRSGFYVRARQGAQPIEAARPAQAAPPRLVTGQAMAMALIKAANDPAIVQLGAAVPDASFLPTQAISRALNQVMRTQRARAAGYMMPPGAPELCRQIARRMGESGSSVPPEDIVITAGCQEALSLALRAVTKPGDIVAVESPTFYGLLHVLESLGLEALEIPADADDGIALDALSFALDRWSVKACVVSTNYSNPLGHCMSDNAKRGLVRLLGRRKVPLIEDDVYGDLGFARQRPSTCKGLAPDADILYCSSFSKTLAPGLRVGWVASSGPRRERVEYLKYVGSIASPTAPQLAVAELLGSGRYERYLREVRGQYASAVARMTDAIMKVFPEDTRISRPQGGFVLWLELPEGTDSFAMARRALREGVSIAPGPLFSASRRFGHCIRLSSARQWDARMDRALSTLARMI